MSLYNTCDQLDKDWHNSTSPSSLYNEWNNCSNSPIRDKDPLWNKLKAEEKQQKINLMCCKEVLQCANPNEWLETNNIQFRCPEEKPVPFPHFGDIKPQSSMLWGVK